MKKEHTCISPSSKVAILYVVSSLLAGCAQLTYPTQTDVAKQKEEVATLNTIADGRAYLLVVRNEMTSTKAQLQRIQGGLDAGILGGAITLALGTALHWGSHTTITAGILTGAALGVDSALSIKTQIQIINKGLDALNCVESQAESDYDSVRVTDGLLEMVDKDIVHLEAAINRSYSQRSNDAELANTINTAEDDLSNAKAWLSIAAIPVSTVNSGIKLGINTVLQTTVDQLNSTLPDGSAFAKISTASPNLPASPTTAPVPNQLTSTSTKASDTIQTYGPKSDLTDNQKQNLANARAEQDLILRVSRLNSDMASAKAMLETLGTVKSTAHLPVINCALSPAAQSLQVKSFSGFLVPNSASSATASVSGGATPFGVLVTASTSGLNPEAFGKSVSDRAVILTGSPSLKPGTYNVTVSDHSGTEKTLTVIVAAAPIAPKLTNQTSAQTWQHGKNISFVLPADTFTDPQGETLSYSAGQANGQELPAWLHFDPGTRTFSNASSSVPGNWSLKVTATNPTDNTLSTSETFILTVQ
ncbi:putative Ig domain-containing protein [Paraburkholderia terrae]